MKAWETADFPIADVVQTERGATVVVVEVDGLPQRVVVADPRRAERVRRGEARNVRVRYFAKTREGLRQPSVKAVW